MRDSLAKFPPEQQPVLQRWGGAGVLQDWRRAQAKGSVRGGRDSGLAAFEVDGISECFGWLNSVHTSCGPLYLVQSPDSYDRILV